MTLQMAVTTARNAGATLRKVDGEYQVKLASWGWAHGAVYFTSDIDDAVQTAVAMASMAHTYKAA